MNDTEPTTRQPAGPTPTDGETPGVSADELRRRQLRYAQRLRDRMSAAHTTIGGVVRLSRQAGTPISRATVHNLFAARGVPLRETVAAFLTGCHVPAQEQLRWMVEYAAVYPHVSDPRGRRPRNDVPVAGPPPAGRNRR